MFCTHDYMTRRCYQQKSVEITKTCLKKSTEQGLAHIKYLLEETTISKVSDHKIILLIIAANFTTLSCNEQIPVFLCMCQCYKLREWECNQDVCFWFEFWICVMDIAKITLTRKKSLLQIYRKKK